MPKAAFLTEQWWHCGGIFHTDVTAAGGPNFRAAMRHMVFLTGRTRVAQAVFLAETVLASLVRRRYFLRMYFWIDAVATISMALDISSFMDAITRDISQVHIHTHTYIYVHIHIYIHGPPCPPLHTTWIMHTAPLDICTPWHLL